MLEVLATLVVLFLMLVPMLNMIVGAVAWGLPGLLAGLAISIAFPLMVWGGLRL